MKHLKIFSGVFSSKNIDKLFVVVFFVLLFVPAMNFSDERVSERENRTLAFYPAVFDGNALNEKFGVGFEQWFNDRFYGRTWLLDLYHDIKMMNNVVSYAKAIYLKKNGWIFFQYPQFDEIPTKAIHKAVGDIKKFFAFCNAHKIKVYILLVPNKEWVYYSQFDDLYLDFDKRDRFIDAVANGFGDLGHHFVFPYKTLSAEADKTFMFYKESHHWTEYAAYLGYLDLIKAIQRDFGDVETVSLDKYLNFSNKLIRDDWERDFNSGQATILLGLDETYVKQNLLTTSYDYYDPLTDLDSSVTEENGYKIKHFKNKEAKGKHKVFLSGFSHNENLLNFLPYSFEEVLYYRLNGVRGVPLEDTEEFLKRYKDDLLKYQPDILILTIRFEQIFSEKLWRIK